MKNLKIVGIPIGNIKDITIRVIEEIYSADIVVAEDTREFKKLKMVLEKHFPDIIESIETNKNQKIHSYREQNHESAAPSILNHLSQDEDIVLVSDSGMPAISDPGWRLIDYLIQNGTDVEVVPGPSSVIAALVKSGLPTDRFTFLGFLPRRESRAINLIKTYLNDDNTVLFFESPYRVSKVLHSIQEYLDDYDIRVAACSELTKKFEKCIRGSVDEVIEKIDSMKVKGEWVIAVRGCEKEDGKC